MTNVGHGLGKQITLMTIISLPRSCFPTEALEKQVMLHENLIILWLVQCKCKVHVFQYKDHRTKELLTVIIKNVSLSLFNSDHLKDINLNKGERINFAGRDLSS